MKPLFYHAELVKQIRNILLQDWDPLGIGGNENLKDEYDAYLPELVRILTKPSADEEAVRSYLQEVEMHQMCISDNSEHTVIAANRLVNLVGK